MFRYSELVAQRVPAERMKWYFRRTGLCYVKTKNPCTCLSFPNRHIVWVQGRLDHRSQQGESRVGRVAGQRRLVPHDQQYCQIVEISPLNEGESRLVGKFQMSLNS